jgi:hypothetical protein
MNYDEIFQEYYRLYRAEATVPLSPDDEYTIGMSYANNAISRWENYDNTYWRELFTDSQENSTGGVVTITAGTVDYAAPTAMREAGGLIRIKDGNGKVVREYPIIEPHKVQFRSTNDTHAYFTGNKTSGFTLNLSPTTDAAIDGMAIDYVYYKKADKFTLGTSVSEMSNEYFIVHHMLYPRFRASRNPYLNTALRDAEEALKGMQMSNNSGTWANPWTVADTSGTEFGL